MTDKIFLDTNLWIYAYSRNPIEKAQTIEALVNDPSKDVHISTQVLGELFNVLTRKKLTSQVNAVAIVTELINDFTVLEIDASKVLQAIEVNSRYGYTYWDSLIVATALSTNCMTLYSEDMQHNQLIEHKLHIVNPFLP
jgi:predicted nucleic acid-binding protein